MIYGLSPVAVGVITGSCIFIGYSLVACWLYRFTLRKASDRLFVVIVMGLIALFAAWMGYINYMRTEAVLEKERVECSTN